MRRAEAALLGLARCLAAACLLQGCARPPQSAYISGSASLHAAALPLGPNEAGEPCTQNGLPGDVTATIYCGKWEQPSGRVALSSNPAPTLAAQAEASSWREGLDRRLACAGQNAGTILNRYPAITLACTTRLGGWPQVALVAQVNGRFYLADGVRPALPAIERSIGLLAGVVPQGAAAAQPVSAGLTAERLAAQAFSSGDIGQYQALIRTANRANIEGNFAGAEKGFRAAAALQERVQGPNAPALAVTYASQALQLSDQGHFASATRLFDRAEALATSPRQPDLLAPPIVWHYRGLHLLNQNKVAQAAAMLHKAERAYAALLPPSSLAATSTEVGPGARIDNQELLNDQTDRRALLGVIETRRDLARTERLQGHIQDSLALSASARGLAVARGIEEPAMLARLYRTASFISGAAGRQGAALTGMEESAEAFSRALPGSRTYAETSLLLAGRLAASGQTVQALAACRSGAAALRAGGYGTDGEFLQPCLSLLAAAAKAEPDQAKAQILWAEMFEMGQLAQGSITSQQIAQAAARLSENARDPKVAALIRSKDDLTAELEELYRERDELRPSESAAANRAYADLVKQINALQAKQGETEAALQAASPNYGQLVQKVVTAQSVLAALHPNEAFVAITLGHDNGWTFLLRDGKIIAAPINGGTEAMAALVHRVRASMDAEIEPPPPFDIAAAQQVYDLVLRGVSPGLAGATALSVAPAGPLLSLPFGVMLSGPADQKHLGEAPFLVRQMVIEHVPAPANFISLRKLAGTSRATHPWFGFGDFHPVTLAQAERSFPSAACADSARLLAALPPLPGAVIELNALRRLTGAPPTDVLEGSAFTVPAVQKANLKGFRILHFATHALLPTDLRCQNEPALVTSDPAGAPDATGALLTSSDVAGLDLDADAVVLSACNTGGPGGNTSGESLTGLARSFFYAGARALLVTHWSVNDRSTAYLVALTLAKSRSDPSLGLAGALAAAQRRLLSEAKGDLSIQAHPFYWAALAVIGEGMGSPKVGS
jgi:CHAT domain-containing protein